jgi:hypothetical protein
MMSNLETLKMYLETLEDIQENIDNIASQNEYNDRRNLEPAVSSLDEVIDSVKATIATQEAAALKKWVETFAPAAPLDMPIFTQAEQVAA